MDQSGKSPQRHQFEFQEKSLKSALTWLLITCPNSPGDCYLRLQESGHFLRFQKKGSVTRKSLLQNLAKLGVFEVFIPADHFRQYVDYVEQVMEAGFVKEKIAQAKQQSHVYNLLFPLEAQLPYSVQQLMKSVGITSESFQMETLEVPKYPKDVELVSALYEDIDLASASMNKQEDNLMKIEMESLKRKLQANQNEIEQYQDSLKDLQSELEKSELENRKSIEELSLLQSTMNKLNDEHEDLKRKFNITKSELDDLLAGHKDAKQIYAQRLAHLEKRIEEVRAETQDFKLKYAREIDKTKELQRSLSQAQTNLAKTATALKKFTEKKSA